MKPFGSHVIYAIGFSRDFDITVSVGDSDKPLDVSAYNPISGEIYDKSFFGIGIAFPQVINIFKIIIL